jgi:hypothetical protein
MGGPAHQGSLSSKRRSLGSTLAKEQRARNTAWTVDHCGGSVVPRSKRRMVSRLAVPARSSRCLIQSLSSRNVGRPAARNQTNISSTNSRSGPRGSSTSDGMRIAFDIALPSTPHGKRSLSLALFDTRCLTGTTHCPEFQTITFPGHIDQLLRPGPTLEIRGGMLQPERSRKAWGSWKWTTRVMLKAGTTC